MKEFEDTLVSVKKVIASNAPVAINESSEVFDILLPATFYFITLRPGLIMSKTFDDSLLAPRCGICG